MKKLHLASALVLISGFSTAAMAAPEFYVGAQVGYQDTNMEDSYNSGFDFSSSRDYSVSGVAGGVFAGAKFAVSQSFFIAPEINIGTSAAEGGYEAGDSFSRYDYEIEGGQSYGIGALLGTNLSPSTTLYGRLGYQHADYELKVTGEDTFEESFTGFRYGLGVQTAINEQVAMRLDWSQTQYSDESTTNDFGEEFTFEPTESLLQVGVVYSF